MPTQKSFSRRAFAKRTAAFGAPLILPASVWAADTPPSEVVRMGFIGMGKQAKGLLGNFLGQGNVRVLAVCDVDTNRREDALAAVTKWHTDNPDKGAVDCIATNSFEEITERDDIDAVCIATPDHWHAVITISALRNGKDVYCEKPLTHNIHEGIEVIKEVEANKRILQTGSMQRSMSEFRAAAELVRNGHIGEVSEVTVNFGDPGIPFNLPEEEVEPGLDWERWLGPAEEIHYNSTLSPRGVHNHFPNWRAFREFGGGMVTDWGAHHIDIAHWGLNMDESGPVKALPPETQGDKRGASLIYANGVKLTHGEDSLGVLFKGSEGKVDVTRGKISFSLGGEVIQRWTTKEDGGSLGRAIHFIDTDHIGQNPEDALYRSDHHISDFLQALVTRKKPITHEIIGARSAIACHLMNQAYYNHVEFDWDPATNSFANGTGDAAWLTRDYRDPWKV